VNYLRPLVVVTVLAAAVNVAACSGGKTSASNAAARTTANSFAGPAAAPASTPVPSTTPATPSQTADSTKQSGGCSSIDQQTAQGILGFTTTAGISSVSGGDSSGMKKIDGCVYESAADGSLGYDVVQVDAQIGQAMIGAARARMSQAGAQVTAFDSGLPNSVAFTQRLALGVDSQVTAVAGDRLITVASTRKDGNTAKSRASATAAAKALVSHS
jgi:hypothetical protein